MKQAAEAHPECITQMAFQYRFVPAMLRAKELMDAGAIGEIFSARVCYLHAGYIDPNRPYTWRLDVEKSGEGGALFDLGSHVVDLSRYLLGEFDSVYHLGETMIKERPLAWDPTQKRSVNVDDISMMMFRLNDGGIGTIESSRLATGVQDELRFEVHGSKGALQFNLMQPNFLRYFDATAKGGNFGGERGFQEIECVARYPSPSKLPGPKNTIGWERFHIHSIYNFVSNIVNGEASQPDIADGAKTQAILDAALQSSKTGKWCAVPSI
jgi:predicted dehydrogenase